MKPLCLALILIAGALKSNCAASPEDTRDWAAFSDFNTTTNDWLAKEDRAVQTKYIKIAAFKFWLMYYGPEAYTDAEALAVKPYFEAKLKGIRKKIDLTDVDLAAELKINNAPDNEPASRHLNLSPFKLSKTNPTIKDLRRIIMDFEKWHTSLKS
jgi:hypothetical protein